MDIYRNNAYTGLGSNYISSVSQLFKINSVKTSVYRAYSTYTFKYLIKKYIHSNIISPVMDNQRG